MTEQNEPNSDTRFTNWREVGRGANSTIYQVRDQKLGGDVAIKILDPNRLQDPLFAESMKEGLRNEVLISRSLRHRYICAVHDFYEGSQGFGVVMDLVIGVDLRYWMDQNRGQVAATAGQRLDLLRKLAEALCVAHAGVMGDGIIHRDLKPGNIMLSQGNIDQPIIMDFGCSVFSASAGSLSGFTPKYMAPEQLEAWLGGNITVDKRADLFAFGIMAYELLTDQLPPSSLMDAMRTYAAPTLSPDDVVPPSHICPRLPASLDQLILSLMDANRDRRVQSAEWARDILESVTLIAPEDIVGDPKVEKVAVPTCTFVLGSRPSHSRNRNELPGRTVRISAFKIDATQVTNAAYQRFLQNTGGAPPPLINDPVFGRPDHPVVAVTHDQAATYARWAGGFLPSEAQWECAAKAGDDHEFPWGYEPPDHLRANIERCSKTTTPVRAFLIGRNRLGIWDMCGNVWEWCADCYEEKFYRSLAHDSQDPVNNGSTGERVLRGGSFQCFSSQGRCAFRGSAPADEQRNEIGFRVAYLAADPAPGLQGP